MRAPKRAIEAQRHTGLVGRAGPGRDADVLRRQTLDLVERDLVVAMHPHLLAQLAEVLDQVVGEAIVVVDHQQHICANSLIYMTPVMMVAPGCHRAEALFPNGALPRQPKIQPVLSRKFDHAPRPGRGTVFSCDRSRSARRVRPPTPGRTLLESRRRAGMPVPPSCASSPRPRLGGSACQRLGAPARAKPDAAERRPIDEPERSESPRAGEPSAETRLGDCRFLGALMPASERLRENRQLRGSKPRCPLATRQTREKRARNCQTRGALRAGNGIAVGYLSRRSISPFILSIKTSEPLSVRCPESIVVRSFGFSPVLVKQPEASHR